jgi:hypothetical protein
MLDLVARFNPGSAGILPASMLDLVARFNPGSAGILPASMVHLVARFNPGPITYALLLRRLNNCLH